MSTPKTLTTKDLMTAFGVSHMTILSWRKGSESRPKLPVDERYTGRRVIFKQSDVKAWAKANGIAFAVKLDDLTPAEPVKPGPKASAKAPAKVSALRVKQAPAKKTAKKTAPSNLFKRHAKLESAQAFNDPPGSEPATVKVRRAAA